MEYSLVMQSSDLASMSSVKHVAGRAVLLIVIVALHLLLVLWLAGRPRTEAQTRPAVLNVFTVSSANAHDTSAPQASHKAATPHHSIPVAIAHRQSPPATNLPSSTASDMVPKAGVAPGGCTLARDAGAAIQQDAAAMAELDALPPTIRTSADAVMLWNGEWLDQGAMPKTGHAGSLRRVVEQVVADAPVECRDAEAIGPVFIPIAERDHTVMIVIGSGIWRWANLLAPAAACTPINQATCPPLEARTADEQSVQ